MIGIGKTDIGKVRSGNEDSIYFCDKKIGRLPNLYIVADGMGGHNAGEVASEYSIKFFREYAENCTDDEILDVIVGAVKYANGKVFEMSQEDFARKGMGTTLTAAVIEDDMIYIAHVGDSRLYIMRKGRLTQITDDHSYVMEMVRAGEMSYDEAMSSPQKNIITRAVGTGNDINADGLVSRLEDGDIILICSDGLSGLVDEGSMAEIISLNGENPDLCVSKLIEAANLNGGRDNISVILVS